MITALARAISSPHPTRDDHMMPTPTESTITHVAAQDWASWVEDNDAIVIDVREPNEWLRGTLPGSRRISLANLPSATTSMDPSRAVLLVCAVGARSTVGATWLASIGFENAASLDGGVKAQGLL
jgi:rhodanese-related sulfurtransferase